MRARSFGKSVLASGIFGPGGENVVMPPYGVRDEALMPVFAYYSLSKQMIRQSGTRYNAPEMYPIPMSDALPSPASQMMLGNGPFHLPFRIIASYAAATPAVKLPALPICVCAQGTLYGVQRYELFATYMQPVGPTRIVLSPDALLVMRYWIDGPQPAQVRCPGTNGSVAGRSRL